MIIIFSETDTTKQEPLDVLGNFLKHGTRATEQYF